MKSIKLISTITVCITLFVSCAYNKTELPEPEKEKNPSPSTITYTSHAKAILDAKCATCHSSTPIDFPVNPYLTNYDEVNAKKELILPNVKSETITKMFIGFKKRDL